MPEVGARPRYTCDFFNYSGVAHVPVTGLHDFVTTYDKWVKKKLGQGARD